MSINICDLCYEVTVPACQDTYNIPAGLTPDTYYTLILEDSNGNIYNNLSTTLPDGSFLLTTSEFPDGMFNEWSGSYRITFSLGVGIVTEGDAELTIDGNTYFCIVMNFVNFNILSS